MSKQEVIDWALNHGWHRDNFGHVQMELRNTKYRLKLQKTSIRYEKQVTYSDGQHAWVRLTSVYYSELVNNPDAKNFSELVWTD
jgi:hypothetical protein